MNRLSSLWLTFFSASLIIWIAVPDLYAPRADFGDYLTIATDLPHEEAVARLEAEGVAGVIGPGTTMVYLSTFRDVTQISLTEALERLDPVDPRLDPFLESLGGYFENGEANLIYVPQSARFTASWVTDLLGPGSSVPRRAWINSALSFTLVAVVLVLRSVRSHDWFRRALLPALPWVVAILAHGLAVAVPAVVVLLYLPEIEPSGSARAARSVVLRLAAIMVTVATYTALIAPGAPFVAAVLATVGSIAIRLVPESDVSRVADPDHTPFEPLLLMDGVAGDGGARRRSVAAIAIVLVLAPLSIDSLAGAGGMVRPVPTARGELTASGLGYLAGTSSGLPDMSDYLAHKAYQYGFVYGREYGLPIPGETVDLARVAPQADGSYETRFESVLQFDDEWFGASLRSPATGIPEVLASLGTASTVELQAETPLYSGILPTTAHLVITLAALLPAALILLKRPRISDRDPLAELVKRGRQVA